MEEERELQMSVGVVIGKNVRSSRLAKGLTQRVLDQVSGVRESWINQLENGHVSDPATSKLRALATSLGVTLDDLCASAGEESAVEAGKGG